MAPLQNTDSTSGHYWGLVSTSPLGRRSYIRHLIPTPSSLTLPVAMGLRLPGTLSSATIQVLSLKFYLNQKPARSSSPLPVLSRMEQRVRESHCARDRRLPLYPARSFSATALKRGAAYHASPPFSIVRSSAIFARGAILFHLFIKPAMLIFELL